MDNTTPEIDTESNIPTDEKTGGFVSRRWRQAKRKLQLLSETRLTLRQIILLGLVTVSLLVVCVLVVARFLPKTNLIKPKPTAEDIRFSEGFTKLVIPERQAPFFTLTQKSNSLFGILPLETFQLKSQLPTTIAELNQGLNTSVPLAITQISDTEFELKPRLSLEKSKNVVVRIDGKDKAFGGQVLDRNYSWAFQTRPDFAVETVLPADKNTNVPLNTGIEITFNQDGFEDPRNYLSITPAIDYQIKVSNNILAVVPQTPLRPRTNYTVVLKKGFGLEEWNDPLDSDVVFTFQTADVSPAHTQASLSVADNFLQLTPRDQPRIKVYVNNWNKYQVTAKVYTFNSLAEFVSSRNKLDESRNNWWHYYEQDNLVETSNLPLVLSAEVQVESIESDNTSVKFVQLPEALPLGFYLVELSYGEGKRTQTWLQSSFLSGYVSVGRKQTLVWANRLDDSNAPVQGSVVDMRSGQSYRLDNQGVVQFTTPEYLIQNPRDYLSLRTDDDRLLVLPVDGAENYYDETVSTKSEYDFWSYIYHEKLYYTPGETINVWGVVRDRQSGAVPSDIRLKLSSGRNYYGHEPEVYVDQPLSVQADGTFMAKMSLPSELSGWAYVSLNQGDLQLKSSGFEIKEFAKPELNIKVTTDKKAIFANDTVEHQVQVEFFDGTPASQMDMRVVTGRGYGKGESLTTDTHGQLSFTQTTKYESEAYYKRYPQYEGVTFYPGVSQDRVVEGYGSVVVYGSSYDLELDSKQDGSKASFSGVMHTLDLEPLNQGLSDQVRQGVAANTQVTLSIEKKWTEVRENGTYYNFVEKTSRQRYSYEQKQETVVNTQLITDQQGRLRYEFEMEEDRSYTVTLEFTDPGGRKDKRNTYFYYYPKYRYWNNQDTTDSKPRLSLKNVDNVFSVDESIQFNLTLDQQPLEITPQTKILLTTAKAGRMSYSLINQAEWQLPFLRDYIPNVTAAALIFNGQDYVQAVPECEWQWRCGQYYYYYNTGGRLSFDGLNLVYDSLDSQLEVGVTSDQQKVKPGDQAQLKVQVTKAGQPVANATVQVAIVDQALAAIGGVVEPDILAKLYTQIPNDILFMYYSHQDLLPDPSQAEKGGGGGDNRSVFKDTAYFGVVTTNNQGEAVVEVQIPDNITTWLVYAQAVTNQLDAGQGELSLASSLPFFITSNFPKNILQTDKAEVSLNSFGVGVKANQTVGYTLQVGDQPPVQFSATAFKPIYQAFGALPLGTNNVITRGRLGNYEDGIELPINIQSTRLDLEQVEYYQLTKDQSITGIQSQLVDESRPITLRLFDRGKGVFYRRLVGMCRSSSNRVEKLLASNLASPLLEQYFGHDRCNQYQSLTDFQKADGGVSQVRWGGADLATSAWATYVAADEFDKDKLISYFRAVTDYNQSNTDLSKIYRSWGLSLLGEPEMIRLQTLSKQAVSPTDKIIATLALATTGNGELAREQYLDLLAEYAYVKDDQIRIFNPDTEGEFVVPTSLLLLTSTYMDQYYSQQMYNYIYANRSSLIDQTIAAAEIAFMKTALEKLPNEDTVIDITSPVFNRQITLTNGKSESLNLPPAAAKTFTANITQGLADIDAAYHVRPDAITDLPTKSELIIKRTVRNDSNPNQPIQVGDLVLVTIDVDFTDAAPLGEYSLIERVPSGLRLIEDTSNFKTKVSNYWDKKSDQIYEYNLYNNYWWKIYGDGKISYLARAAYPGEYIWEVTSLQSRERLEYINFADETPVLKILRGGE